MEDEAGQDVFGTSWAQRQRIGHYRSLSDHPLERGSSLHAPEPEIQGSR